jgi:dTDP-D-glucose 4,6-dehydratase
MILVTGATGHLGSAIINYLLKKLSASQIVALVRDVSKAADLKEKGVDIRIGNYEDSASLDKAMQGIEKVLLIAGTDEENRVALHRNVVDAAKSAGVKCIAYTSRNLRDPNTLVNKLMEGHFQRERIELRHLSQCVVYGCYSAIRRRKSIRNGHQSAGRRGASRLRAPQRDGRSYCQCVSGRGLRQSNVSTDRKRSLHIRRRSGDSH